MAGAAPLSPRGQPRALAVCAALALAACGSAATPPPTAPPAPDPTDEVKLLELQAQPAMATTVRARPDELRDALGRAILGLIASRTPADPELAGPPFARYLSRGDASDPTLVVEVGLPVARAADRDAIELPAGPAATLLFVGPHPELPRAHAILDAWLARHQRTAAGPRWEVYLTNPITTPDPAAQRTLVVAPLAPPAQSVSPSSP